ncbi:recombination protein RecT [Desulfonispora thiosulfatigenes DSM 11270]|uniref:Recombination protein RecT n=1 Tax=Desulfonispora thiosulfatigenes DSM 11270 TaxID=656914 RepID=A0A1W1VRE7_DESTI|nr:recombinase RecT [Desulfonispora thiosulfatigenes]SMB95494.1 recombination protein RecT [Desulfonispora thiosulfatigenes DSM 11270]
MSVKNALANKAGAVQTSKEPKNMKDWIKVMEPEIKKALPSVITPERFTRMALSAISVNPALAECTPKSFMGALMNAAQLGLEPNTPLGQAYLIPYRNKGVPEVQFQLGYKGMIDLAHRSGEFTNIYAKEVYENDVFEYEFGLEPNLVHKPASNNRGNTIAYYAVFKLVNGGFGFEVMSKDDITNHARKYSQGFNSKYSPWSNNFDEMAKKTVLKKVLKYAPIKVEFVKQVTEDGSIKTEISENMTEIQDENVFEVEYEAVENSTVESEPDSQLEPTEF